MRGGCIYKGVDFHGGADKFTARAKGKGRIEIRLDDIHSAPVGYINVSAADWKNFTIKLSAPLSGKHDLFFVFGRDVNAYSWYFMQTS